MIAPNKWIISSPTPFSTTVQCDKSFTLVNLKSTSIVEIPEGCKHASGTHTIWLGSYTLQIELEINDFKWIWKNSAMFPNFNDKAKITITLLSLNYLFNYILQII
jgi:hypothetical protein